jgi:hypothetical protein
MLEIKGSFWNLQRSLMKTAIRIQDLLSPKSGDFGLQQHNFYPSLQAPVMQPGENWGCNKKSLRRKGIFY